MEESGQEAFNSNVVVTSGKAINAVWEKCRSFFDGAPVWRLNPITPDLVLGKILSGEVVAHVVFDTPDAPIAILVTHFEHYHDGKRSLFLDFFGADDFLAWQERGFRYLDSFAKKHGCCAVEYVGRPGFSKINAAFQEDGRLFVKMLED